MNEMVPILTGYIAGLLLNDGTRLMKVEAVTTEAPDRVRLRFASGLTLLVTVTGPAASCRRGRAGDER